MDTRLPEGVQDFLTVECFNKKQIEDNISKQFSLYGYRQVDSPIFEYADTFTKVKAPIPNEKIFKFFEMGKRTMALRADATMPLARIAAAKMITKPMPIRLSYLTNVYRIEDSQRGLQREIAQAGVELIGIKSAEADAEVISLAIETLTNLGLSKFKIDIGQVDFFKSLIKECSLDIAIVEEIRCLINQKSKFELEHLIDSVEIKPSLKEAICALPSLYGGVEMLDDAKQYAVNNECFKAIENLMDVYQRLSERGYAKYISFDLGMVQSLDYYSGIIFRGLVDGYGHSILGGGRYDNLLKEYGRDLPATGFAIGIKRLMITLEKQNKLQELPTVDYLVVSDSVTRKEAYQYMNELRQVEKRVELFLKPVEEITPETYAKRNNIKNITYFEKGKQRTQTCC